MLSPVELQAHKARMYDRLCQSVKELYELVPDGNKQARLAKARAAYLLIECCEGETE